MKPHKNRNRILIGLALACGTALLAPALTAQSFKEEAIQTVLISPQAVTIASPVRARIAALTLFNGDAFSAGQSLIKFDCAIEEAQLAQAKAKFQAAEATLAAREKLGELDSISELDLKLGRAEKLSAAASPSAISRPPMRGASLSAWPTRLNSPRPRSP
ncbi:MAG TPA: hypothetical protein PLO23_09875 [Alphaproteobacteria bacterium]|nr:hypothetical protein [Alphaproteobacteria bacterium]